MSEGLMRVIKKLQEDNKALRTLNNKLYEDNEALKMKNENRARNESEKKRLDLNPEMLASISHEFRTPMNIILGMIALALRENISEKVRGYLSSAQESSYGLLDIIRDIFDYFKMESGVVSVANLQFVLDDVLNGIIDSFRDKAINKGLELILIVNENVPKMVVGDTLLIEQVLSHLVSNAIKFTEKGHIIIKVMLLKQTERKVHLVFSVEDTGIGIEEERSSELFSSFSQADNSKTRLFGGLGLGLNLCKRWVDLIGGTIWMKSDLEKGSTFFFTLELGCVECLVTEEQYMLLPEEKNIVANYKILLVDDNPVAGKAIMSLFAELGCTSSYIESTVKATELLYEKAEAKEFFDIVIIDKDMPEIDGLIMARILASELLFQNTAIVILLNENSTGFLSEMAGSELKYFLNKPVQRSDIYFLLKQVIADSEERLKEKQDALQKNTADNVQIKVIYEEFTKISEEDKSILAQKLLRLKDMVAMHEIESEEFLKSFSREIKSIPEISDKVRNIEKNLREFAFNSAMGSIDMILMLLSEASVANDIL